MTLLEVLLALLAAIVVLSFWRMFHTRRGVEINERGILVRELRLGWIRWDEIEGAYHPSHDDQQLHLRLRVSERMKRRMRRSGRATRRDLPGSVEVQLDLSHAGITPFELLQVIMAYRDGGAPPVPAS